VSEVTIKPLFTDAGLAAIENATGNGLQATIAEIAIGDAGYAPGTSAVGLQNELVRVNCSAGGAVGPQEVLLEAQVPAAAPEFFVREIGFFLDDGTLLALWSDVSQVLGYRSALSPWFFKFVLKWSTLPVDSITVSFNGDAAQAALALDVGQTEAKIQHTVESEGMTWDPADNSLLTQAITAIVDGAPGHADFQTALAAYLAAGGYLRRDVSDVLAAGYWATPVPLDGSSGTAAPDLTLGNVFTLDTSGSGSGVVTQPITLADPASVPGAGMAIVYAAQDATGGHALTLGAGYRVQAGTWSTDANAVNVLYLTMDGGAAIDVTISQRGEA